MADLVMLESLARVLWDPAGLKLVLVPRGAPMWEPVRINGSQAVQTTAPIRAGVKNHPRDNEANTITFTLARIKDTVEDASAERLFNIVKLPRTMKDIVLTYEGGRQFRAKNCAIESWPDSGEEARITRETLVILCGEIVLDGGTYADGDTWGEVPSNALLGENGEPILGEDGDYILSEEAP